MKLGKIKEKSGIKEVKRTTPQSWKNDKLRMIGHKRYNSLIRT